MAKEKKEKKEKTEKAGSGNVKLVIIMFVLSIVTMAAGAAGGYLFITKTKGIPVNTMNTNNILNNTNEEGTKASEFTVALKEEFLLNLADEGGKRLIKAKISVGYDNKKLTKEISEEKTVDIMRDIINTVLRAKKAEDFKDEKSINGVKKEILERINQVLKDGKVSNIYFPQIIVQ